MFSVKKPVRYISLFIIINQSYHLNEVISIYGSVVGVGGGV